MGEEVVGGNPADLTIKMKVTYHDDSSELTKKLINDTIKLWDSNKPTIIAGVFYDDDVPLLDDKMVKHFKTAPYLWNMTPMTDTKYKGLYKGLLNDNTLTYVHFVLASRKFIEYTLNLK